MVTTHGHCSDVAQISAEMRLSEYDPVKLENLLGHMSISDSQRVRKQEAEDMGREWSASEDGLEQRAKAEDWLLKSEVCPCSVPPHVTSPPCGPPCHRKGDTGTNCP